jgi:hypothetical protein
MGRSEDIAQHLAAYADYFALIIDPALRFRTMNYVLQVRYAPEGAGGRRAGIRRVEDDRFWRTAALAVAGRLVRSHKTVPAKYVDPPDHERRRAEDDSRASCARQLTSASDPLDLALPDHVVELHGHAPHKIGAGLIGLAQREAGVFGHVLNVCPKMVDGSLPLEKP